MDWLLVTLDHMLSVMLILLSDSLYEWTELSLEVLHYSRFLKLLFLFFTFFNSSSFFWILNRFPFCFELICALDILTCIVQNNSSF